MPKPSEDRSVSWRAVPWRAVPWRRSLSVLAVLLGIGGLGVWWAAVLGIGAPHASVLRQPASAVASPPSVQTHSAVTRANAREPDATERARAASVAGAAPPAAETAAPDELRHPHPITPAHQRIFEENDRVGALNGAMDRGDFEALRRMNAEYRAKYPEDAHALQAGYDLIADCLEAPTPRVVAAARQFWKTERASTLRRHVRRHCLENQVPR